MLSTGKKLKLAYSRRRHASQSCEPTRSYHRVIYILVEGIGKKMGQTYKGNSIIQSQEYGSSIYTIVRNGKTYYSYTEPSAEGSEIVDPPYPLLNETIADIHSHGK